MSVMTDFIQESAIWFFPSLELTKRQLAVPL
jgi:hypothetical protein